VIDGYLNWLFIRTVQTRQIDHGVSTRVLVHLVPLKFPLQLTKYDRLLKFNKTIVVISLSLDVLLIGLMSLPNDFVFVQFQSLAYLIKVSIANESHRIQLTANQLEIEMATSQLIVKVAMSTGIHLSDEEPGTFASNPTTSARRQTTTGPMEVSVHTQIVTKHDENAERHGMF